MDRQQYRSGWKGLEEAKLSPEEQKELKGRYLSNCVSFAKTFSTPSGQEVLRDLSQTTYGTPSFNFKSENAALEAAFTAGMREVVEYIMRKIEVAEKGDL